MTKEAGDKNPSIFVAISGGVDSAVVLKLLKDEPLKLAALSHRHWPDSRCCSTACLDACRAMCQKLDVPYRQVDLIAEFTESIVEPFTQAYQAGITPNPCVHCNAVIRFDLMIQKFHKSQNLPVPENYKIATGHYAQIVEIDGSSRLKRGMDEEKDQSYMLYRLSPKQLSHCLFPLGTYHKYEVRQMAVRWQLSSAKAAESQDICFVADDYRRFIRQFSGSLETPGDFLDLHGKRLGRHRGIFGYSRGQRKGMGLSGGPWFVLRIEPKSNTIILGRREELDVKNFTVENCVWHLPSAPAELRAEVQVRYHGRKSSCLVHFSSKNRFIVELENSSPEITPGQSAVFYIDNVVAGGGIIQSILS